MIDFKQIRRNITTNQILEIMMRWGVDNYEDRGNLIVFPTVCHNSLDDQASMKLYYYDNSKLFHCYTECDESFDIFELGIRIAFNQGKEKQLFDVVDDIVNIIDYTLPSSFEQPSYKAPLKPIVENNYNITLKKYEDRILNYFKTDSILLWENEGIKKNILKQFEIGFYKMQNKITIPHRDLFGNLVGIRGRALNYADIEKGKYMPLFVNGIMYSHPLSFNLYGMFQNIDAIKKYKTAYIFEGEKSVLLSNSYYGKESLAVASCGSTINKFQIMMLIKYLGVRDIVICFDRQFETSQEEEKYFYKLNNLGLKYKNYVNIDFIFDD